MDIYRETYVKISLKNIEDNVRKIIQKYSNYDYYFGVVKADCYGHGNVIDAMIKGGCNYLAVALLEEALEIRRLFKEIPILYLGVLKKEDVSICIQNQITASITSLITTKELIKTDVRGLNVHLKLNTGMNRLGISSMEELKDTVALLKQHFVNIEGIYTHIYDASNLEDTTEQFEKFHSMVKQIDPVSIVHICASEALVTYPKMDMVNGCRLGVIMYGFTKDESLKLHSTFSLHSKIIQINELKKGDKVGYNGAFVASKAERIAVVPIGYADGIIRKNTGRCVYINGKPYPIVGNICMDMLFVQIDEEIKLGDEVLILKDIKHIDEVSKHLETIPYEVLCSIGKRVPRIYLDK